MTRLHLDTLFFLIFYDSVVGRHFNNDKFLNLDEYVNISDSNNAIYFGTTTTADLLLSENLTNFIQGQIKLPHDTTEKQENKENEQDEETNTQFNHFTPKFTSITCEVDGDQGICTPSAYFCKNIDGLVISTNMESGGCGIFPCCLVRSTCGNSSNKKIAYFVNPLGSLGLQATCDYKVDMMNENICQVRLDFLHFDIARPRQQSNTTNTDISCRDDAFVVTTANRFRTPILCGYNTGQHLYLPVNGSNGEKYIYLSMYLAVRRQPNFPDPKWKIKITQYECPANRLTAGPSPWAYRDFTNLAPPGCLQYFTDRLGTVCNFGFQSGLDFMLNFYGANQKYAICFKRSANTCGIKFTINYFMLSSTENCLTGDYLFIPGAKLKNGGSTTITNSRFCGNSIPNSAEIISDLEGPLYIQFETDGSGDTTKEHGFCLNYEAPPASGCS